MYVPRLLLTALVGALTMVLVAVLGSGVGSAPAQAAEAPESPDFPTALSYSWLNLEATPPGANDWSCRPSQRHPRPVVLLHGTWENRYANFAKLSPELKREGYCVFALNYGWQPTSLFGLHPAVKGTADIRRSSKELAAYVEKVLGTTGAPQVDIVGHSQGGMMPRQYLKFDGGANPANPAANKVHTLVGFGPTNHGTTLSGLATLSDALGVTEYGNVLLGDSATQQVKGSPFLAELNAGGDTMPGVNYMVIATQYDEVTTPYESAFLTAGPGATVTNVTLQDGCAADLSEHVSMTYSPRGIGFAKKALDPDAADPPCVPHTPVV